MIRKEVRAPNRHCFSKQFPCCPSSSTPPPSILPPPFPPPSLLSPPQLSNTKFIVGRLSVLQLLAALSVVVRIKWWDGDAFTQCTVGPMVMKELKRIVEDSEIIREDDNLWYVHACLCQAAPQIVHLDLLHVCMLAFLESGTCIYCLVLASGWSPFKFTTLGCILNG